LVLGRGIYNHSWSRPRV